MSDEPIIAVKVVRTVCLDEKPSAIFHHQNAILSFATSNLGYCLHVVSWRDKLAALVLQLKPGIQNLAG